MTIADLIKELLSNSRERLKNPIFGAYIWSFIIFNWKIFAILIFSKLAVEDRIYIIEIEYINGESFYIPAIYTLFYVAIFPFIQWIFDWPIVFAKKIRLVKETENKNNQLQKKIELAGKEFELKEKQSGNKQIEDFLVQIEQLKNTNQQIIETNKNTIEQLQDSLKDANDTITVYKNQFDTYKKVLADPVKEELNEYEIISRTLKDLSLEEIDEFRNIKYDNKTRIIKPESLTSIKTGLMIKLESNGFVARFDGTFIITDKGMKIVR